MTGRACAALALAGLVLLQASSLASAWGNVPLGTKIPELTLPSTAGKKVKLTARGSKATVLLYIRPAHERSSRALAELIPLVQSYGKKGLRAFVVSTTRGQTEAIKKLAARLKVPFPVLIDAEETFYGTYGVFVHPTAGVVDAKGVLRYEYAGHRPDFAIAVERQIKAVLGLGPPPDQIEDLDRRAVSKDTLKSQRQDKMKQMMQKLERKRAHRRLVAAGAVLSEDSLETVLKLYRAWAELLPLPADEQLAALATQVRAGKALKQVARDLADLSPVAEVALWHGRALAGLGERAPAQAAFEACLKSGDREGQCAFELAGVLAVKSPARAVELCKQAFQQQPLE